MKEWSITSVTVVSQTFEQACLWVLLEQQTSHITDRSSIKLMSQIKHIKAEAVMVTRAGDTVFQAWAGEPNKGFTPAQTLLIQTATCRGWIVSQTHRGNDAFISPSLSDVDDVNRTPTSTGWFWSTVPVYEQHSKYPPPPYYLKCAAVWRFSIWDK